ncbi:MAG: flagellar hook-length control protein FliK [Firmicutes bacterium]|nr:flagellar hook-length control protein FliK [Bacillota bacterium]
MMQVSGGLLDLVPTQAVKSAGSDAPSAKSPVGFEQLLTQISALAGDSSPDLVPQPQLEEDPEKMASKGLEALAALLAQSQGLTLVPAPLEQPEQGEGLAAEEDLVAVPEAPHLNPMPESQLELVGMEVMETPQPQGVQQEAAHGLLVKEPLVEEVKVESKAATSPLTRLVEVLQELEANTTISKGAMNPVQPTGWGELERYWLLRGSGEANDEAALTSSEEALEAFSSPQGEKATTVTAKAAATREGLLAEELEIMAETLAAVEERDADSQMAVQPGLAINKGQGPVVEQNSALNYTARPGTPLLHQLEQGIAMGVRQLRFLQSQESISMRLQLYPESLGEVRVELKLEGNVLTAQLQTFRPEATEALRLELPLLRENLVNQGFTQVFLGAETAPQFGQSFGREQQPFQEEQQRRPQRIGIVKTEDAEELEVITFAKRLDYRL